ncbi:MAG: thioredoxin family protein [Tissierellia bacterium]|nr:thioredoxin family protein [Tissierellia bacterium]
MKKRNLLILLVALLMILAACGANATDSSKGYTEKDYDQSVKAFKKVDIKELNEKVDNKDDFVVYLGRKTCPFCLKLVPDLEDIMKELGQDTYYLDVEETNKEMDAFFDKYNLEYVPSLLVFKQGQAEEVKLDHEYAKNNGTYDKEVVKSGLQELLSK